MRNLKRALSLTLASVMLLGMMVVGTSAASYPDVTEEHNVEAIEVLQAVGVMSGSDSGNFNPDSQVSRIEMAVVMSNLLNLKVDYFENQCRFTDVPAWAGKYVAACEASGIVSGIGNNQFGTGNVTATQAALMMLKALGYFQYASDFAGGWEQETAKLAANLSLFKGLDSVYNTTELTRNQVAQLALNVLKTPVVVPDDNTLHITTTVGGADTTVTSGKVTYKVTASQDSYAYAISSVEGSDQSTISGIQGAVIELGEKLYDGKLQLRENGRPGDGAVYDDFGRPARRWQYDGTTFGTYPKKEELRQEYTTKVTGKMLYDLLGSDIVNSIGSNRTNNTSDPWYLNVTIDGETTKQVLDSVNKAAAYFSIASILRTNDEKVGNTGDGTLTQVYMDSVHHLVDIAIINTYLAQADQNYNSRDNDVDLNVFCLKESAVSDHYVKSHRDNGDEELLTANGEDFDIEDVKEDDFFLVTIAQGEIKSMTKPEIVSETTLNSFKKNSWVKNDDAQYDYATTAQYDAEVLDEYSQTNMKDVTYNVILDQYGYLIGIELNEAANQYLFLTGMDLGDSNLSKKNASANVIMLDGTMQTVTVNVDKSECAELKSGGSPAKKFSITGGGDEMDVINDNVPTSENSSNGANETYAMLNTWCTYTVDSNGVYTLKQVGTYSTARKDATPGGSIKSAKKIAQSYIDVGALGTYSAADLDNGKLVINNKNTSLPGTAHTDTVIAKNSQGTIDTGDFTYVYGNDETVYINASLKAINPKVGSRSEAIVNKIDSVTTGIANVDFDVADLDATKADGAVDWPASEVYALYKDNGYLIGVVILDGEDNGVSSHYVYVTDTVSREDYNGNSEWEWYREAIVDGKKTLLTEVADDWDYLEKMEVGKWYSVTYDKDGHVNGIKDEEEDGNKRDIKFQYAPNDKFVTKVEEIRLATNGLNGSPSFGNFTGKASDTVLLYRNFLCNDTNPNTGNKWHRDNPLLNEDTTPAGMGWLMVEGQTLYTDESRAESTGIRISPNTKTVLITSKGHGTDLFDSVEDGYEGADGLERALNDLNSETRNGYRRLDGYLTAVCDRGVATVIIINDQSGNGKKGPNEVGGTMEVEVTMRGSDGTTLGTTTIYWDGSSALTAPTRDGWTSTDTLSTSSFREGEKIRVTFTYNKAPTKSRIAIQFQLDGVNVGNRKLIELTLDDGNNLVLHKDATIVKALADDAVLSLAYEITSAGDEIIASGQTSTVNIPVTLKQPGAVEDADDFMNLPAIEAADEPIADYVSYGVTAEITNTADATVTLKGQVSNLKGLTDGPEYQAALHVYSPSQDWTKTTWEALYDIGQNPTTHMGSSPSDTSGDKAYGFVTISVNNFTRVLLIVQDSSDDWYFITRVDNGGAVSRVTTVTLGFNGISYDVDLGNLTVAP